MVLKCLDVSHVQVKDNRSDLDCRGCSDVTRLETELSCTKLPAPAAILDFSGPGPGREMVPGEEGEFATILASHWSAAGWRVDGSPHQHYIHRHTSQHFYPKDFH